MAVQNPRSRRGREVGRLVPEVADRSTTVQQQQSINSSCLQRPVGAMRRSACLRGAQANVMCMCHYDADAGSSTPSTAPSTSAASHPGQPDDTAGVCCKYNIGELLDRESIHVITDHHKDITQFPEDDQHVILGRYVSCLLNMYRLGGIIDMGVSDENEAIGIALDQNEEDALRMVIHEAFSDILPRIFSCSYSVHFIPVVSPSDRNQPKRLRVVELDISAPEWRRFPYAFQGFPYFFNALTWQPEKVKNYDFCRQKCDGLSRAEQAQMRRMVRNLDQLNDLLVWDNDMLQWHVMLRPRVR